jgi:hypothetical protein
MTERKTIDVTAARRQKSLEFRLAKITTASDEEAAPYQSKASIYRGLWLDDSTARAAMLTGADVWTQGATTVDDWLLVVRTPFGRWDGVPIVAGAVITEPGWVMGRKEISAGVYEYGWVETVTHESQHPE